MKFSRVLVEGYMFRFAKPDGLPFNLDYLGVIHAFDSGNEKVAICRGEDKKHPASDPSMWGDWEIIIPISRKRGVLMQQALASAYTGLMMCERLIPESISS